MHPDYRLNQPQVNGHQKRKRILLEAMDKIESNRLEAKNALASVSSQASSQTSSQSGEAEARAKRIQELKEVFFPPILFYRGENAQKFLQVFLSWFEHHHQEIALIPEVKLILESSAYYLEKLGEDLGIPRDRLETPMYRLLLYLLNQRKSAWSLENIFSLLMPFFDHVEIEEKEPASFYVNVITDIHEEILPDEFHNLVKKFKAPGVLADLHQTFLFTNHLAHTQVYVEPKKNAYRLDGTWKLNGQLLLDPEVGGAFDVASCVWGDGGFDLETQTLIEPTLEDKGLNNPCFTLPLEPLEFLGETMFSAVWEGARSESFSEVGFFSHDGELILKTTFMPKKKPDSPWRILIPKYFWKENTGVDPRYPVSRREEDAMRRKRVAEIWKESQALREKEKKIKAKKTICL